MMPDRNSNGHAASMAETGGTRIHVAHVFFGQARKLSPLMAELRSLRADLRLTLIVPEYDQAPEYLEPALDGVDIRYLTMRTRRWSARQTPLLKLLRFVEFTLRGMRAVRREWADITVAHDMPAVLPLLARLLVRPARVIFHAHELWTEMTEDNVPLRRLWRRLETWTIRRAARVIVPEPNRARILHEEYGARELPAVVMNVPPDPPPFQRGSALRERLGLPEDAMIILYQGLIAESRCIIELARAVATLPEHMHLVLIGVGEEAYLTQLRKEVLRAGERIHILPWMHADELRTMTASADMGVLLYRNRGRNNYYAAPNKVFEYLFAGLPLVASDFPGLRAMVADHGFGACADPERPDDIARAITDAAKISPSEDIAMQARAQWSWADQAEVLRREYNTVIERNHGH